jgi:lauroyl/myristoyl acyltransferase
MPQSSVAAKARSLGHHWSQQAYIGTLRFAERIFGPGSLAVVLFPLIVYRFVRHFSHYPQFRKLRSAFPVSFWKGVSPVRHFWRTFADWTGATMALFFYDRFRSPAWKARFTVRGTPPHLRPEWGQRPFVIVFIHSGGFPVLKAWMRSQGIPAALYAAGIHAVHLQTAEIRERGDRAFGVEKVADTFAGRRSLLEAARFLTAGRALLISLEQRDFSKTRSAYPVGDATICLDDGAFRIAGMTGALLIPAAVRHHGICRFEIEFGDPVTPEAARGKDGAAEVNLQLIRQLWHGICNDPSAMTWTLMEALAPDLIGGRGQWP